MLHVSPTFFSKSNFLLFCRVFIITSNGNLVFARSKILENEKVNWSQEDISKTKRMKNTSRMKLYAETRAVWQFSNHSNWNETFFFWLDLEDRSWNVFPNWLLVSLYSSPIHPNVGGGGFLRKLLSLPSHSGSDGGWLGGGGIWFWSRVRIGIRFQLGVIAPSCFSRSEWTSRVTKRTILSDKDPRQS